MDKVTYTKQTLYSFFSLNLFKKTEIYTELSGDVKEQRINIYVRPDYYEREFNVPDDKEEK